MKSLRLFWLLAVLLTAGRPGAAVAQSAPVPAEFTWVRTAFNPTTTTTRPGFVWSQSTTDAQGNTYAWISYRGSFELDGTAVVAPDTMSRMALAKLDLDGHLAWLKELGVDSARTGCYSLTTDAAGNVLAAGINWRKFVVEGSVIDNRVVPGAFLIKWTSSGALVFAQPLSSGGGAQYPTYLTTDAAGNVYVAGAFSHTITFAGGITITKPNSNWGANAIFSQYCAKLSPQGVAQWAQAFADTDTLSVSLPNGLGVDRAGNVYLLGIYTAHSGVSGLQFPFAPGSTAQNRLPRWYWAKLDGNGHGLRAATFDAPNLTSNGGDILFDVDPATGFGYVAAPLTGSVTLAPGLTLRAGGGDDLLVLRLDPNGAIQWTRQFGGAAPADDVLPYGLSLAAPDHRLYLTGQYRGRADAPNFHLTPTDTARTAPYQSWVASFDPETGRSQWARDVRGSTDTYAYRLGAVPSGVVVNLTTSSDTVRVGNLLISAPGNRNGKMLLLRLAEQYNTLTGAAYLDANADGQQNATETGFPGGLVVEVNPGAIPCVAPEATGRYDAYVGLLNTGYTAALASPPAHYTVVPQGPAPAAPFASYGNAAAARSFALRPIPGQQDVQVLLTQISPTRPGWPVVYDLTYRNTGTVALPTGTVTLTADPRLTFTSASAAPGATTGALRTWAYAALAPGEARHLRVVFGLPTTVPIGEVITSTATVTPLGGDLLPLDNTSTAARTVTGSFDPNDIEVNHLQLSTQQVAAGEWLEYTIRFQNHGTDTAFTVALHDSLPADRLRIPSLQFLAASHTCGYGVNALGQLIVTFPGIRLPSQATDLINSDGFVRFRIQPLTSLVPGDAIPNQARIHFDYNAPLATNTALTTVAAPLGLATESPAAGSLRVWPNPATGTLYIDGAAPGPLTLLDALGREVRVQQQQAGPQRPTTLSLNGLPPGLYVLRAGTVSRQVVVTGNH